MERWERLMIQASKQSLTNTPPVLRDRMDMNELIAEEMSNYDAILWGCMPQETQYNPKKMMDVKLTKRPVNALLIIGPEGDLSTSEKQKLSLAGAIPVILSSNRLRTETASVIMVSMASMLFSCNRL
jgi:16S rRNA (uracil1498-N3)-methyltransferase